MTKLKFKFIKKILKLVNSNLLKYKIKITFRISKP